MVYVRPTTSHHWPSAPQDTIAPKTAGAVRRKVLWKSTGCPKLLSVLAMLVPGNKSEHDELSGLIFGALRYYAIS